MAIQRVEVEAALGTFIDPITSRPLLEAAEAGEVQVQAPNRIRAQVRLGYPARSRFAALAEEIAVHISRVLGEERDALDIAIEVSSRITSHDAQQGTTPLPNVKNIIAVASGKGGVGKSTTAVNLALALVAEGARVGILDADIYGPSLPMMLGIDGRPTSSDGKTMDPLENHGLQAISIGFLIDPDEPMVWRGPMVTQALQQLLSQTNWKDLDYLIVDMPPGTGDIQLTLSQKVPVTGAVIVTTPQDIALLDARKGLRMFEKVGIPILGVIENMSMHICSNCGHAEAIFGSGGASRLSSQYAVEYLGGLPLDIHIREQTDAGVPTVAAEPDGAVAKLYRDIARRAAARIALRPFDEDAFPTITVEDT